MFFQKGAPGILKGSPRPVFWVTRQPGLLKSPINHLLISSKGACSPSSKLPKPRNNAAEEFGVQDRGHLRVAVSFPVITAYIQEKRVSMRRTYAASMFTMQVSAVALAL